VDGEFVRLGLDCREREGIKRNDDPREMERGPFGVGYGAMLLCLMIGAMERFLVKRRFFPRGFVAPFVLKFVFL
jgi:hypothetical protein